MSVMFKKQRAKPASSRKWNSVALVLVAGSLFFSLLYQIYTHRINRISSIIRGVSIVNAFQNAMQATTQVFHGVDIEGETIKTLKAETWEECSRHCEAASSVCNAFSICLSKKCSKESLNMCVLKSNRDITQLRLDVSGPEVGWESGVLPPSTKQHEALLLARGLHMIATDTLILGVRNLSGTIEVISPRSNPFFSFALPWDSFARKADQPGHHRLGDLSVHVKKVGGSQLSRYSTVTERSKWQLSTRLASPSVRNEGNRRFYSDLTNVLHLHRGPELKALRVERWIETPEVDEEGWIRPGEIRMKFQVTNDGDEAIEIGAIGASMIWDQYFVNRKLEQVAVQCSFVEAYVGGGFGYIQVTRANGDGPTLLILPTPGTSFEAWRPLRGDDRTDGVGFGFEGHHEILFHSKSWAEDEWKDAKQWVQPSSRILAKSESYTFGIRMVLALGPTQVEAALRAAGHPVVIGIPGFILHHDMNESKIIVQLPSSENKKTMRIESITVEPSNALVIQPSQPLFPRHLERLPSSHGNLHYRVKGISAPQNGTSFWSKCKTEAPTPPNGCPGYVGRVRVKFLFTIDSYKIPREQVIQLLLLPPARWQVEKYGRVSSHPNQGWLVGNSSDPWHRGPAFMGLDNEEGDGPVKLMAEPRVFMSGLSDEAGAAQPLAMAIKQTVMPVKEEIDKLESYVAEVLSPAEGADRLGIQSPLNFSVRASLFYYDPNNSQSNAFEKAQPAFMKHCSTSAWWLTCWSKNRSSETWRAYNYPHVAAVYWSLYRVSRYHTPPLTEKATWNFYLHRAARTAIAMYQFGPGYGRWGLMVGSVFTRILGDLEQEGWMEEASEMKKVMDKRIEFWQSLTFPFGSEMAWDNTGHEEIYSWLSRIGDEARSESTVRAILAYDGLFPHWALSGSARRWWDFFINGKTNIGNERVHHHYAATLNSIPLMSHALRSSTNEDGLFYLRLAMAGIMGSLSNIKLNGGPSMGFHGDPTLLRHDGYSADFGIGFFGHAINSASTLYCQPYMGCVCFYCDANEESSGVRLKPNDAFRKQTHLLPIGVSLRVFGASIAEIHWRHNKRTVFLKLTQDELCTQLHSFVGITTRPVNGSQVKFAFDELLPSTIYSPCKTQNVGKKTFYQVKLQPANLESTFRIKYEIEQ